MSVTREREIAWRKSAKGRGNRWQILRDVVALVSMNTLTNDQLQDAMLKLRGITRPKVNELIEDLNRAGALKQVAGTFGGIERWGWSATENGVKYWIGSRTDIPARIVEVASTTMLVYLSEVSKNE